MSMPQKEQQDENSNDQIEWDTTADQALPPSIKEAAV